MSELVETIFVSETSVTHGSASLWDSTTGTNLMLYKGGGIINYHTLCVINENFLLAGNSEKPLLHIWPINSQDQVSTVRLVLPGKATAVAVTPDGNFMAVAVNESVYIYQICSGKLICVLSKHYQSVTTIKFVDDGSHFVCSGKDGIITVWSMASLFLSDGQPVQELYYFNNHSLPVSDICIGVGGIKSYLYTASIDRTCRIYNLASGECLLNIQFDEPLTCVKTNLLESAAYFGSTKGNIYEIILHSPPRTRDYNITNENAKNTFCGHKGSVTCISISLCSETMLSGSEDGNIFIWNIQSRQIIRTLPFKGQINNAFYFILHKNTLDMENKITFIGNSLKRMVSLEDEENHICEVNIQYKAVDDENAMMLTENNTKDSSKELQTLRQEVEKLRRVNKEIFTFSVNKILNK